MLRTGAHKGPTGRSLYDCKTFGFRDRKGATATALITIEGNGIVMPFYRWRK